MTDPRDFINKYAVEERQAEADADEARKLVQSVLNGTGDLYRTVGADRLLAAAAVYATLALRG